MIEGMSGVSTYAADVDRAIWVVHGLSLILFFVLIGAMFYFAYKYSASRHDAEDTKNIKHYKPIEIAWTVIPSLFLVVMFYYGMDSLKSQRTMPKDGLEVKVIGKKWSWSFEYPNGKKTEKLFAPAGANVKLSMTAPIKDVTHSFFVPAFRNKEDVIPGAITKMWFNVDKLGKYDIECAEYCGTGHSYMLSQVVVIPKDEFDKWYNSSAPAPGEENIKVDNGLVVLKQNGCTGCHSMDGTALVGPSFKGMFGRKVKVRQNGKVVEKTSDFKYLKDSILDPDLEVVEGFYPGIMPPFKGVLSDKDVKDAINYIKTLK